MGNCINKGYCKHKDDYKKNCKIDDYTCKNYLTLKNEMMIGQLVVLNAIEDIRKIFSKIFKKRPKNS